ncbi:serine protease-like protein [Archaeoglobales archaeon]|nr:MAG: serine protease-like protein [Archaeoglobales archaeon]
MLIFFIVSSLFIILSNQTVLQAGAQFLNANEARIKAVAVKSTEPPEGAVINISVIVTPGDGRVFVSTIPYTQIDMQGSAQLAALTACDVLGLDFMKYDFFFTIEADSPIVGGPSAGGVMTVAAISALKNLSLREDVYMTGMIYPDGFIGPVGGIPYKLKAAADNGAKIFLIPKGQRVVTVEETVEEKRGPFIFISKKSKPVDLYEYGKELGVKVIEVEKIEDALLYYTNYTIAKSQQEMNLSRYSNLLLQLAERMKKDTTDLYSTVKATGASLKKADEFISKGDESYKNGYYYTATSQYFTAKIELRYLYYTHIVKNDNDLEVEFGRIENEINSTKDMLSSQKELGVESFQLFGAAQERVTLAEDYLYRARTSDDFEKSLRYLALSKERIESAKVWLSLLETIKEDIPIKSEDLQRRAQFYLSQAESMVVYASQIGGYPELIDEAEKSIDISRRQLEEGFFAGSAISAIDGITKASLSIELINVDEESLNSKISSANNSARTAIGEVEKIVTPVLPVAYLEYADTAENPVVKLSYYKLSERLAKLMLSVSRAFPESTIVKVELNYPETPTKATPTPTPTNVPDISKIKPEVPRLPEIEKYIPGFEAYLAFVLLISTAYLIRGRIRRIK